jgi:hypothetical protein
MLKHWYHKGDSYYNVYSARWVCQSITPTETFVCESMTLFLSRQGTPTGTLYYEIYAADGSGNPTGVALASKVADYASQWGFATATYWVRAPCRVFFDTPVTLNAETQYVLLARMTGGDSTNCIGIWRQASGDYAGGNFKTSTNSGGSWTQTTYDMQFDLWDATADGVEYVATMRTGTTTSALIRVHRGTNGSTYTGAFGIGGTSAKLHKSSKYLYLGGLNEIRRFGLDLVEDAGFQLAPGGQVTRMVASETQNLLVYTTSGTGTNYGVYDLATETKLWSNTTTMSDCDIREAVDEIVVGYSSGSGGYWNGYRYVASSGVEVFKFWANAINLSAVPIRQSDGKVFAIRKNTGGDVICRLYDETGDTYQWESAIFSPATGTVNKSVYIANDDMVYITCNRDAVGQRSLYKMTGAGTIVASKDLGGNANWVSEFDADNLFVSGAAADDGGGISAMRIVRKSDLEVLWRFDPDINTAISACEVLVIDHEVDFTIPGRGEILIEADAELVGDPDPVEDVVIPSDETGIATVWPIAYRPETPLVEHLLFETTVNQSLDMTEERIPLRKCPRIQFEWKISESENRQSLDNLLYALAMDWIGIPFWHEPVWLTNSVNAGVTVAPVTSTAYSQFLAGMWALVISPSGVYDLLEIETVAENQLTFTNATTHAYKAKAQVIPVYLGVAESIVAGKQLGHATYDIKSLVEPVDNDLGLTPYTDGELSLTTVNYMGSLSETFSRPSYRLDGGHGKIVQTVIFDHAEKGSVIGFVTHSRAELWLLREMLCKLQGKCIAFRLATFAEELTPVMSLTSGQSTLTITQCGYTDFIQSRRGELRIVLTNGTVLSRTVVSSVNISGTVERITVDEAWSSTITIDEIERIEYLDLVRFDSDDIIIEHRNAIGSARCEVPVVFVEE